MSLVKIDGLSAGYGKENIIENISFEINEGEIVGVLGLNGSGKSTLAKSICNILPYEGTVCIGGKGVEKLRAAELASLVSYIPQRSGLGIDISVSDVVMMGFNPCLGLFENPGQGMKEKALKTLETVGLLDKKDSNYMLLSEGQKQLVILARALVSEGSFMVMDEPENALDFSYRYKMMSNVKGWVKEGGRAAMVILHDTGLALNCCDKLLLIKDKCISGILDLSCCGTEAAELALKGIYGSVRLAEMQSETGEKRLVMFYDGSEI